MATRRAKSSVSLPGVAELISLEEAAELCGLSSRHLRHLISRDELWGKKIGRNWVTTAQAVLRIDPQYFDALYISGLSLVNLGKWEEALGYFESAMDIEPENSSLELQYAFCLVANGRGAEAAKIYDRLKKENPRDYRIYQDMAIMYESLHDLNQARENMKQAVDLNPGFETYFNYAILLEKTGDLREAVYYLKRYLETTPEKETPRRLAAQKTLGVWESRIGNQ